MKFNFLHLFILSFSTLFQLHSQSNFENLALAGNATQSSTNPGVTHEAFRAIDNNTSGIGAANSIAETEDLPNSYWQVELVQNSIIDHITLYSRFDCDICLAALSEYTLEVLDENNTVIWSQYFETALEGPSFSRNVAINAIGKTVRVVRNGRIYIAEAQVFGTPIEEFSTNLALSGNASQSSTSHRGNASRAIDNNTNGKYRNGSVTHTDPNKLEAWWQVELAQTSEINQIQIYNRTDNCCADRLSNYIIEVLDESGNNVFNKFFSSKPNDNIEVINLDVVGKIVRIRLYGILSLSEVQVFGTAAIINTPIENNVFLAQTNEVQEIVTYPNPVTENIFIKLNGRNIKEKVNLTVFNYDGAVEASGTFLNNDESIINMNLSNLEEGFYILQIQSGSNILGIERIYVQ